MRTISMLSIVTASIGLTLGCGETAPPEPTCDLTLDTLVGKSFIMSEAQPKGDPVDNPLARMTFVDDDGLKARYTSLSVADVYTYECEKGETASGEPELTCSETPRLQDWCEALLARDQNCTRKKMRKLGTDATDDELDTAIKAAKASQAEVEEKGSDRDKAIWKAMRRSLGNKLQGKLYIRVDQRCRLSVGDMYWTMDDKAEKVEDSNPVGTNPFVMTDKPWLFEHCDNQAELYDLEEDARPKLPLTKRPSHAVGKPIFYYHTSETAMKPEEGCTYSMDTYAGYLPKDQGVAVKTGEDGNLLWRAEHTFAEGATNTAPTGETFGMLHMVRNKECAGKKEVIDVSCRVTVF